MLTSDSYTCQGYVLLALQTSQVREPRLFNVCSRRQIFINLVRLFDFTGDLVNLKLSTVINHYETVLGSGYNHQDVEGGTRRGWQKHFVVAGRICYQNVTCRCANEEFPIDPTVAGVICRNEVSVLFYEPVMHECQLHVTVEFHVAVNILSRDEQKSGIFWVERDLSWHRISLGPDHVIYHQARLVPQPDLKPILTISSSTRQRDQILL